MGRRLARVVVVRNERHEVVAFGPNDDVPDWAVPLITNPKAWADEADEDVAPVADDADTAPPADPGGDGGDGGEGEPAGGPPAGELTPPDDPPTVVEKPARNASKAAWLAYAIGQGMPEEDAERRNRDELADFYSD